MKGLYFLFLLNANCYTIWLDDPDYEYNDDLPEEQIDALWASPLPADSLLKDSEDADIEENLNIKGFRYYNTHYIPAKEVNELSASPLPADSLLKDSEDAEIFIIPEEEIDGENPLPADSPLKNLTSPIAKKSGEESNMDSGAAAETDPYDNYYLGINSVSELIHAVSADRDASPLPNPRETNSLTPLAETLNRYLSAETESALNLNNDDLREEIIKNSTGPIAKKSGEESNIYDELKYELVSLVLDLQWKMYEDLQWRFAGNSATFNEYKLITKMYEEIQWMKASMGYMMTQLTSLYW
jgi:hypothetical protein